MHVDTPILTPTPHPHRQPPPWPPIKLTGMPTNSMAGHPPRGKSKARALCRLWQQAQEVSLEIPESQILRIIQERGRQAPGSHEEHRIDLPCAHGSADCRARGEPEKSPVIHGAQDRGPFTELSKTCLLSWVNLSPYRLSRCHEGQSVNIVTAGELDATHNVAPE